MSTSTQVRPKAVASGMLWGHLECHVLEDETRVLTQRGILRALRSQADPNDSEDLTRGRERGDLGQYLARLPSRFHDLTRGHEIEFDAPQAHGGSVRAIGRPVEFFIGVLRAYSEGFAAGELHRAQLPMAKRAVTLLSLLAGKALERMIDEACGYHPRSGIAPVDPAVIARIDNLEALIRAKDGEIEELRTHIALLDPCGSGVIGKRRAEVFILAPLREAARLRCALLEDFAQASYRSYLRTFENELRMHVDFPQSRAMHWAELEILKLGRAVQRARSILERERIERKRVIGELKAKLEQLELPWEPPPTGPGLASTKPGKVIPLRPRKDAS
jgi:hypothetical protein